MAGSRTNLEFNSLCDKGCDIGRIAIAGVLLFTAFTHLQQPYLVVHDVLNYELLGGTSTVWFSAILPFWEILTAIMLVGLLKCRAPLYCTLVLLGVFMFAQLSALIRGLNIDCGCFGGLNRREIGWQSLAFLCFLIILIAALLILQKNKADLKSNEVVT